jgi:protein tyrosine phosphatase (PTP) superfamily phosphohydrolase (DUF442 family)
LTAASETTGADPPPLNPALTSSARLDPEPAPSDPGRFRFSALEPGLAAGRLPGADDVAYLAEKGYKTLLDLGTPDAARLEVIRAASEKGMRYVALPIALDRADLDDLKRFEAEIRQTSARPIYVFDNTGRVVAAAWYWHRLNLGLAIDKVREEAADIGLPFDSTMLNKIESVLKPRASHIPSEPPSTTIQPPPPPPQVDLGHQPAPRLIFPSKEDVVAEPAPPLEVAAASWQPYGSLAATLLAVPVVYFSRTVWPGRLRRAASRMARARRS